MSSVEAVAAACTPHHKQEADMRAMHRLRAWAPLVLASLVGMGAGAWIAMNTRRGNVLSDSSPRCNESATDPVHSALSIRSLDRLHPQDPAARENTTIALSASVKVLLGYTNGSDGAGHARRLLEEELYNCIEWDSGELRSYAKPRNCVDVAGYDGTGRVGTHLCDGHADQTWVLCLVLDVSPGAFTIRSRASGFVLEEVGWNVEARALVPGRASQHWYFHRSLSSWLFNGVKQPVLAAIGNRGSGRCLRMGYYDGNLGTHYCRWYSDQAFFIYSRGAILGQGILRNRKSGELLDVADYDGTGNVATHSGDGYRDQVWTHYESGEVVNSHSRHCLDVSGYDGRGNIGTYPCEGEPDQRWKAQPFGRSFMLVNHDSSQCLDVAGYDGRGNIATYDCEYVLDQTWYWQAPEKWSPIASWQMHPAGCHNHDTTFALEQGVSRSQSFTHEVAISVTQEISAGVEFEGFSSTSTWSTTVSFSLSATFEQSWSLTAIVEKSCPAGCMWQMELSLRDGDFTWHTPYTLCSPAKPTCQPVKANAAEYCYRD